MITEDIAYPIGEQDFKSLREMGCVYIDKTMYIEKILRQRTKYLFFARPRRFGKSLFLSTLRYFFEGERHLFQGLHIDSFDWDWQAYPVLYLDLNTDRFLQPGKLEGVLNTLFRNWERKYEIDEISDDYSQRFKTIIETAHEKTGRQVVILVDEYDKPLVGNLNNDEAFEEYRAELASIYSNLKSSAEHIRFVFLTGVSRFSKLSVFSDLNNIRDISFSNDFADLCGITEREMLDSLSPGIEKLAKAYKISFKDACSLLKRNYDGYKFAGEGGDIYNPWSLFSALAESRIGLYWSRTGMPVIIAESLKRINADLEKILNTACPFDMLSGLDLRSPNPLALLYQTGYLTIKDYDLTSDIVRLGVPNIEVKKDLFDVLLPYYIKVKRESPTALVFDIVQSIKGGEPEKMIRDLDIFFAGIPYDMKMEDENNLHNALYILLSIIGIDVHTEVHTSCGRIDLLVTTPDYIYIIELKFNKDSNNAIDQIEARNYESTYLNDARRIFKIGVNFSPETSHLDKPIIYEVEK